MREEKRRILLPCTSLTVSYTHLDVYKRQALKSFGIEGVASVRQGKVFDIEVETQDKSRAEALLREAAEKLLANMVVENYKVEVVG